MSCHITDLHNFYQSPLGKTTRNIVLNLIKDFWPSVTAQTVLGVGYPLPYFDSFLGETKKTFVFMPVQQGVDHWPVNKPGLVSLIEEHHFPLPDESIDRLLLIHCLEHTGQVPHFLREVWRILSPEGRLLIITPNRRGIWARLDYTPFGHGNPYTMTQLTKVLISNQFTPLTQKRGLYTFPSQSRFTLPLSPFVETIGDKIMPKFSGILALECTKQIYALPPLRQKKIVSLPTLLGVSSS